MSRKRQLRQVEAPKGLDISRPTTEVMPIHVGFAQLFSQKTESVAQALWDKINYQLTQLTYSTARVKVPTLDRENVIERTEQKISKRVYLTGTL